MIKTVRQLVPTRLKRLYIRGRVRILMRRSPGRSDGVPRISFAGILPSEGSFVRGGKVKLTHLRNRFGEFSTGFNVLYLVSSSLPPYPDIWVREARRTGVRVVWNQDGVGYLAWTKDWKRHNQSMLPLIDADFVAYQSKSCREGADQWVGAARHDYDIVYNCVDTDVFCPADTPLIHEPIRLLVMGTHMTPEKVLIPLEALALLTKAGIDATLSIIGPCEFPDAERLITRAVQRLDLGHRVHQSDRFLQSEAPESYRRHHVFVHLKYMDPCPTAVIEAMACGLPVIGSASGGMPELVSHDSGVLIPVPHDWERMHYPPARAVADAVRQITKNMEPYRVGARRNAVSRFDVHTWLEIHERIFRKVLGQ